MLTVRQLTATLIAALIALVAFAGAIAAAPPARADGVGHALHLVNGGKVTMKLCDNRKTRESATCPGKVWTLKPGARAGNIDVDMAWQPAGRRLQRLCLFPRAAWLDVAGGAPFRPYGRWVETVPFVKAPMCTTKFRIV